ncbi:MAG: TetR/AcrR family transcriptional regulator C-terminal domain-containing protein [Rhizobiales bacterium]|nr:TetR/AcrR family transcriptional regulator C-terminal domain-containing protein [Hyphomicrobiales bacterium]MBI3674422.1 TetR/AcrR family transcriptional regulator C-terminal domain-containing protein [Hyphomicrobiales bacterium]
MPAPRKSVPKKRQPLSAARIAREALALIDAEGLDGFSFRILARQLGCEAMSIYHYFPSKAHLYDALVEICLNETVIPPPGAPWLDRLREFCLSFRNVALRHPGFFLYLISHRLNNRAGLSFLNRLLQVFEDSGLSTELRARHFRTIGYYVMGAGLDESMGYVRGPSAVEPVPEEEARRDYPSIMAVGPYFKKAYHEETFRSGLEIMLRQMAEDAARESSGH